MRVPTWLPSVHHRFVLVVLLDLLRSDERGTAPYIPGLVTLGGRATRDGHLKTQPLALYFDAGEPGPSLHTGLRVVSSGEPEWILDCSLTCILTRRNVG
jgi:hypothetical protein